MTPLKRILLFVVCLVVIGLVAFFIGGAIVGASAGQKAKDIESAHRIGVAAGQAFGQRYGLLIWLGALVSAAGIAFRGRGLIIAGGFAVMAHYFLGGALPDSWDARMSWNFQLSPPAPPPSLVGRRMALVQTITVTVRYGKARVPAGTIVDVIADQGETVHIRVAGGQTVVLPKAHLQ